MHAPMAAIAVRISMVQTTSPATPPKTLPSQAHVDQPLGREPINLERPADVRFGADCVAKLFRSRSQGSVLSAGGSLVVLPGVGGALLDATLTQGRRLPKVAGHGREAWRAA